MAVEAEGVIVADLFDLAVVLADYYKLAAIEVEYFGQAVAVAVVLAEQLVSVSVAVVEAEVAEDSYLSHYS